MHPPAFAITHRLSDWPDCSIEVRCGCTGRMVMISVKLALRQGRDRIFQEFVAALRCRNRGAKPAPVYLVVGHHREWCGGPSPCWAVQLVPVPQQRALIARRV